MEAYALHLPAPAAWGGRKGLVGSLTDPTPATFLDSGSEIQTKKQYFNNIV